VLYLEQGAYRIIEECGEARAAGRVVRARGHRLRPPPPERRRSPRDFEGSVHETIGRRRQCAR
jgi:hypothetical protein